MPVDLNPIPPQPDEKRWTFIEELRTAPYHQRVRWKPRAPSGREAHFPEGIRLDPRFEDPRGLLETAHDDFRHFLGTTGLAGGAGSYPVVTRFRPTPIREAYQVRVTRRGCELGAGDPDGIRRGLVWIEDEILRRGGPFLPIGALTRTPVIRTRLSRCFYGPVNRPPKSRDELADDVDYYPDEYLNRLAHDGVNGLWFTIHFFQTVPSQIIPEYGRNAGPRLEKLRRTVRKCERHGIRIYPFCIEPAAFTWPYPEIAAAAAAHPDLIGHGGAFCTGTDKGRAYLEEATRTLFREAPGLGGLLVIPVGERLTHCYSTSLPDAGRHAAPNTCPRCSKRQPHRVLSDTLAAMLRGMRSADPSAELVAWPYGQFICWGEEKTVEAAGHMPEGVILQHNFETGGRNRQLGKWRPAWDYWLSYAGPSDLFRDSARAAVPRGTRVSAKLQVGCSHEVATTQTVPVPGLLYRKYRSMHRLGVSGSMNSWYFGAYPSLMTRAAGELSFAPFPARKDDFLLSLAKRDWGRHAPEAAKAWRWFEKGYSHYPTAHIFGYYGPMHDGPVWPLHLTPRRLPLAPTWQIGYPPSGDYIAECITNGFTLKETLLLCGRMAAHWERGVKILKGLRRHFRQDRERSRDIRTALALGLQFRSGHHILKFYSLRERLAEASDPGRRRSILRMMKAIVREELQVDRELLTLSETDSQLGFHSEAEGYKYFPALIRWRMARLKELLRREFPEVERRAGGEGGLFPDYTGESPAGEVHVCRRVEERTDRFDEKIPTATCDHWLRQAFNRERWRRCAYDGHDHLPVSGPERGGRTTRWDARHDGETLTLRVECTAGEGAGDGFRGNGIQIYLEPVRTEPRILFHLGPDGSARCVKDDGYIPRRDDPWRASSRIDAGGWHAELRIPLGWLGVRKGARPKPMQINVVRTMPVRGREGTAWCSWAHRQPCKGRLVWGFLNPATDFGWLRFEGGRPAYLRR